ncbi:MAG TPA: hypothetical protein VE398_22460, partial [Acidobacteriota bacterium]|nr:hypothetical protein [Acidobacteriota bacterium]
MTSRRPFSGSRCNTMLPRLMCLFLICRVAFIATVEADAAARRSPDQVLADAEKSFERGEFGRGIEIVRIAIEQAKRARNLGQQTDALLMLAQGYDRIGRRNEVVGVLEEALKLAPADRTPDQSTRIQDQLAIAYWRTGQA